MVCGIMVKSMIWGGLGHGSQIHGLGAGTWDQIHDLWAGVRSIVMRAAVKAIVWARLLSGGGSGPRQTDISQPLLIE